MRRIKSTKRGDGKRGKKQKPIKLPQLPTQDLSTTSESLESKLSTAPMPLVLANKAYARGLVTRDYVLAGVCSGLFLPQKTTKLDYSALEIGRIFAEMYAQYFGKRQFDWMAELDGSKAKLGCASRAAIQADMLGAAYAEYIEAQFYWIHDRYARPPYWAEIGHPAAILRCKMWLQKKEEGCEPAFSVHPAELGDVAAKRLTSEAMLQYDERVLVRMCRKWGGEAEVWEMFGHPKDNDVFSLEFKLTRVLWRQRWLEEFQNA